MPDDKKTFAALVRFLADDEEDARFLTRLCFLHMVREEGTVVTDAWVQAVDPSTPDDCLGVSALYANSVPPPPPLASVEALVADPYFHSSIREVLQYFAFRHLPAELGRVSRWFAYIARVMVDRSTPRSRNPEFTKGLAKLLEAKDCFVRAFLPNRLVDTLEPVDSGAGRGAP